MHDFALYSYHQRKSPLQANPVPSQGCKWIKVLTVMWSLTTSGMKRRREAEMTHQAKWALAKKWCISISPLGALLKDETLLKCIFFYNLF